MYAGQTATGLGGYPAGQCSATPAVPRQESVEDLLNHLCNLADSSAGLTYRIANALGGSEIQGNGQCEPKDTDPSLLSRLRKIRSLLQAIDANSNRARYALGIE